MSHFPNTSSIKHFKAGKRFNKILVILAYSNMITFFLFPKTAYNYIARLATRQLRTFVIEFSTGKNIFTFWGSEKNDYCIDSTDLFFS